MNNESLKGSAVAGVFTFGIATLGGALTMNGYGSISVPEAILLQIAGLGIGGLSLSAIIMEKVDNE